MYHEGVLLLPASCYTSDVRPSLPFQALLLLPSIFLAYMLILFCLQPWRLVTHLALQTGAGGPTSKLLRFLALYSVWVTLR